jgi:tRNA (cmo5U34)-methyltransferase
MRGAELLNERDQLFIQQRTHESQAQSCRFPLAGPPDGFLRPVEIPQNGPGILQKKRTGDRQGNGMRIALEKPGLQFGLQGLDVAREGRLRKIKLTCRLGKAEMLGNRDIAFEFSNIRPAHTFMVIAHCYNSNSVIEENGLLLGMQSFENKSTLEEIRTRFDQDVERFSNLESGQQAAIDAPLVLELVAQTARRHLHPGDIVLDVGCGAGNFTLKLLNEVGGLHCKLADLSRPMLDRAHQRVRTAAASVTTYQSDLRALSFAENSIDCILAGAVLHHLRDDRDWTSTFASLHRWLKPGGWLYVSDLAYFDVPDAQEVMWQRYGDYLTALGGPDYREQVFAYIDKEDSPRSLSFQLDLLRSAGFSRYDVLHRNSVFACYFGVK